MTKLYAILAGIVVLLGSMFGFYKRGQSTGAKEEKQEHDTKIANQQAETIATVKETENEIATKSDADVDVALNDWVRNKDSSS